MTDVPPTNETASSEPTQPPPDPGHPNHPQHRDPQPDDPQTPPPQPEQPNHPQHRDPQPDDPQTPPPQPEQPNHPQHRDPQPDDPQTPPPQPERPNDPPTPPPQREQPNDQRPAPGVRRLYRSRHDRKIGGVAAGVAEFFRIDPTIVRLATLVFAVTGIGVFAYLAAWLIMPERPEGLTDPHGDTPSTPDRNLAVALGIAALAIAFGMVTDSWVILALALIGGGIWLLSEHSPLAASAVATPTAPPRAVSGYEPSVPIDHLQGPIPAAQPWTTPTPDPTRPSPQTSPLDPVYSPTVSATPRPHQRITWGVLSVLALLAAVGIAASTGDWWDVSATRFLGIGLVVIGIGVVAGQLLGGGARGLIPLGVLAAIALFPVSAVDGLLDDGIGEERHRPNAAGELQSSYQHGIGQMIVDLTEVDFADSSASIDVDLGIGELIVIIPDDVGGEVVMEAKAGELSHSLTSAGRFVSEDGLNIDTGRVHLNGDNGSLDLDIYVGLGTAELRTEPR